MSLADDIVEEIINEGYLITEVTVAADRSTNGVLVYIDLDPGKNFGGKNAYFKCIPHNENIKNFNPARISFTSPEYIIHYKSSKQFKLDNKQKKSLIKLLNKKHESGYTNWQVLIIRFNEAILASSKDNSKYKLSLDLPIPDYEEL